VVAVVGEERPGEQPEIAPAGQAADVEVEVRRERQPDRARRALEGDRLAHRHPQVELELAIARLPELDDEARPDLERAGEVGHAAARALGLALGRHRSAEAHVDGEPSAFEEDRARTFAVGAQDRAAIGEERDRQHVDVGVVRASIVVEAKPGNADAELPERQRAGFVGRGALDRTFDRRRRQRHLVGARGRCGRGGTERDERRGEAASPACRAPHGAWTSTSRMLSRRRFHARTVRPRLPSETR
jgi:hypothetical protein